MINGIRIQKRGGDFGLIDLPLNSKQMQLAMDKSNIDASWNLLCDSINQMYGISIIGNYNLINIIVNGNVRPLH
jgi:hypothetical protein